jgi:hypothetical protein
MKPADFPNWTAIERDVLRKIRLVRAAWKHTEAEAPEVHEACMRDLYVPALTKLAAFCACVKEE